MNKVIQAMSYLKPRLYVPMMPNKIDYMFISMFAKFTMCIRALIIKVRASYMPPG